MVVARGDHQQIDSIVRGRLYVLLVIQSKTFVEEYVVKDTIEQQDISHDSQKILYDQPQALVKGM